MTEDTWPFTGRRSVLAEVVDALRGEGLVLRGAAGVGKSRVLAEAVAIARDRGVVVHEIHATDAAATVPFGAAAHLLPSGAVGNDPAVLTAAASAMASAGTRVALAVDDADRLDPQSAALVHHLVLTTDVAVVVGARSRTHPPDAVHRLWNDGLLPVREVPSMSHDEVAELVHAVLDGPLDSALRAELVQLSGGNPLLLRQVLRSARAAGRVRRRGGLWQASGSLVVGGELPDMVAEQLTVLPDRVRGAAELVALGEPLEARVLVAATDPATAEALEATGLVTAVPDRRRLRLRMEHPLFAEAIRAQLGPMTTAWRHGQLADASAPIPRRRQGDVLRRGVWALRRDGHGDAELLLTAARAAHSGLDRVLAADLAEAAAEAGSGDDALLLLAECLPWRGEHDRATTLLDELGERAQEPRRRIAVAELRAEQLVRRGDEDAADEVLRRTIEEMGQEAARALQGLRGRIAWAAGRVDRALEVGEDAVRDADEPAALRAATAWILIRALTCAGRPTEARALAEELQETLGANPELDGPRQLVEMAGMMAVAYGGDAATATSVVGRRRAASLRGPQFLRVMWSHELGQATVLAGRPRTAIRVLNEVAALFPFDVLGDAARQWIGDGLAHAHGLLGDGAAARRHLDDLAMADTTNERRLRRSGAVWALAAESRTEEAVAVARTHAAELLQVGATASAAWLLDDAARLGAADVVARELEELAATTQGTLIGDLAALARGLADDDPALLTEVGERFADAGWDLHAAEAVAAAVAELERRGADPGELRARAVTLRNRTEGARTPLLARGRHVPELTPREAEVARLAAEGHTDQQIADLSHISIRTVQTHLHRSYTKLGISDRARLPDVLG